MCIQKIEKKNNILTQNTLRALMRDAAQLRNIYMPLYMSYFSHKPCMGVGTGGHRGHVPPQ